MTNNYPSPSQRLLKHIQHLSVEIGPRGPTRSGEKKGHEYGRDQLLRFGLDPQWETYPSARSIFHPHLLGACFILISFILFAIPGLVFKLAAAVITVLTLISEVQELSFMNNLLRMAIPKGQSQNVFATIPPSGEHRQDLVLVGHMDSQRTPFIFRTPKHVRAYDLFTMVAFVTFLIQAVIFSIGVFTYQTWMWYAAIPSAVCAILLAAMCLQAEATPFTAGANDNATAVGMVLTLAEDYAQEPLINTRIFAILTGCEEVQHYGMINFYQRHLAELRHPKALVFEMLGVEGPAWIEREGIVVPFRSDPKLSQIASSLSEQHPEWGAYQASISGGNSEMSTSARFKVAGLCLFGLTRSGVAPYWHQVGDTYDKMKPEVLVNTYEFSRAIITSLDQDARD